VTPVGQENESHSRVDGQKRVSVQQNYGYRNPVASPLLIVAVVSAGIRLHGSGLVAYVGVADGHGLRNNGG